MKKQIIVLFLILFLSKVAFSATINVTSPNTAVTYTANTNLPITWISSGVTGNVNIEYTNASGTSPNVIVSNISNSGSYNWLIPSGLSGQYKIKIYSYSNNSIVDLSDVAFTIVQPSITVNFPNTAVTYTANTNLPITWISSGVTGNVNIEYTNASGTSPNVIVSNISNSGSYNWLIPSGLSGQYKIKIYSYSNNSIVDLSDVAFTIVQPSITVNFPNTAVTYTANTNLPITWISSGVTGNVNIEYTNASGTSPNVIVSNISNSGSYNWLIPSGLSGQYKIKIYSYSNNSIVDLSDVAFTIVQPSITVTSPNTAVTYTANTNLPITWISSGVTGNVNIEYTNASGTSPNVIVSNISNSGSYNWLIPSGLSGQYKIKIYSYSNNSIVDLSDVAFTIVQPSITVTSPNTAVTYTANTNLPITWISSGVTGNVNIEYTNASGTSPNVIVSNISNSGSYNWLIPNGLSGQYKIKIYSYSNNSIVDLSDVAFTIVQPSITVTSPNTAVTYTANTNLPITWISSGVTGNVNIEYTNASGTSPNVIVSNISNSGSYNWLIPSGLSGQYKIKIYSYSNNSIVDLSDVAFTVASSSMTLIYPNGGETLNKGQTYNITWSSASITGNVTIEYTDANQLNPLLIIGDISNSGSYSWNIPIGFVSGQYKIKIYTLTNSPLVVDYSNNFFTITGTPTNCITWTPSAPTIGNGMQIDQEAYDAMQYLCAKNIIQNPQLTNQIDNNLRRDELAKITFKALFSPNGAGNPFVNGTTTYSDDFPVPYYDLQPPYTTYQKEAKAMCYLEYSNCVSPFDRDFTHFRPADTIWKKHALKEILEAFNIAPAASNAPAPWPSGIYTDVVQGFGEYGYIVKAYQLGIIGQASTFGTTTSLSRRNAFRYLYKLLQLYDANSPLIGGGNKPIPQPSDYYTPFNQKVGNMNNLLGIDQGAFNSYTKTSFGIAGKMPLVFAHSYNSANSNFPTAFNVLQPMGKGWNHNYNCYIKRFDNGSGGDIRYTVFWGDGTLISFDSSGTNVFTPLDKGVYSSLQLTNGGNTFTFTTKSKVAYKFERQTNLNNKTWCLIKISDRNNNYLNITWQVVNNEIARVNQVADPQNRQLNFTYTAGSLTGLQCVAGSIVRNVNFTYNAKGNLQTYTDPMGHNTTYIYDATNSPCLENLVMQIQLPKGNIINNAYNKRKLESTNFAGQYATQIVPNTSFINGNNIDYTSATITTTQAGQTITTNLSHNELGNVVHIDDATSDLDIGYNTVGQPTKPTSFTNTTNGITATTNYDANGNVLSVTKTASSMPTITESFTYNLFNDVLTYTNANSNTTSFVYNGTGNLTSITDALSNTTTIIPNADGTVQKVTNPSGFYTEYVYDNYGNTTLSKLQNVITSTASYDAASRLITATNPNNVQTKYNYNNNDQVTSVIYDFGNLNNTMSYAYDANGNLTTVTNPKGDNTVLTYNNQDQLTQYNFLGLIKKYAYNQNGTLDTFINQSGNVFKHTYDANGMLTNDGYASYTYHATTKNLQTITHNGNSKVITFGYDNYQRVNSIAYNDFAGNTVQYQYDNTNNITKITYPGGFAITYSYDALGRLYQVKNFSSNFVYATYSYFIDGRLQQCVNGNGTKTIYEYDSFGRLDSIRNQTSSNAIICAYGFTLDNIGNHTSEYANEPFAPTFPSIANNVTPYTHSTSNRMTAQGSTGTTFNNNGNELTNTGALNTTYTWDTKENLLTSTIPSLSCEYDGAENRRKRNNTRFVLELLGDNLLMETNLSGTPTAYYIQGLGLVCRLDASQANPAYYHYDYRGSTTAITNSSQAVTHKYLYGAFGEQLAVAETGFANAFRYVGKYGVMYEDSSLYFMRARYYNPNKGRFLGEDPVWNSNLYSYSMNNPLNYFDISGNSPTDVYLSFFNSLIAKGTSNSLNGLPILTKNDFLDALKENASLSNVADWFNLLPDGTSGEYLAISINLVGTVIANKAENKEFSAQQVAELITDITKTNSKLMLNLMFKTKFFTLPIVSGVIDGIVQNTIEGWGLIFDEIADAYISAAGGARKTIYKIQNIYNSLKRKKKK